MVKEFEKGNLFRLWSVLVTGPILISIALSKTLKPTQKDILFMAGFMTITTAGIALLINLKDENSRNERKNGIGT